MKSVSPHWSFISLSFYCLLALSGGICISLANGKSKKKICYFTWFTVWEITAVFRHIGGFIGGADAISYATYFKDCLISESNNIYARHAEVLYQMLNKLLRHFTDDYHVLFFVIYGILILSYIYFIEEFTTDFKSKIPFYILFYIYLRGFTSIRTNLAVALILFSIVLFHRGKKVWGIILSFLSIFMQKASIIYVPYFIFLYFYKNKVFKIKDTVLLLVATYFSGRFGQFLISKINFPFLKNGAYRWYALYAHEGESFFDNFWKIAFPQMVLCFFVFVFRKQILTNIQREKLSGKNRLEIIYLLSMYDIILIPLTFVLNIWRGYEYFYIVRLAMWCEIFSIIIKNFEIKSKLLIKGTLLVAVMLWMAFRIYNTWDDSGLMPYIFNPFIKL